MKNSIKTCMVLCAIFVVFTMFGQRAYAQQPIALDRLDYLKSLELMLEQTKVIAGYYIKNCKSINPNVERLMEVHTRTADAAIPRVQAQIKKYRDRLDVEVGLMRAAKEYETHFAGIETLRLEMTQAFNKPGQKIDCKNEPATIPNIAEIAESNLRRLENE